MAPTCGANEGWKGNKINLQEKTWGKEKGPTPQKKVGWGLEKEENQKLDDKSQRLEKVHPCGKGAL